jgi:hypothetical protein
MVRLSPDVLGRIEFRRVRREVMDIEPRMIGQERADLTSAMDRAAIPQQGDGAAQVTEEVPEEGVDVETRKIPGTTAEVEGHAAPLGRDGQPATDREAIVAVAVAHARRLTFGRPGPADVGDEQEPAFIDEEEMGATSSGVFLSAAMPHASTG